MVASLFWPLNFQNLLLFSRMSNKANTQNFKVVLLGEGCVGKTSLVLRYVEDKFNERHISTMQVKIASYKK